MYARNYNVNAPSNAGRIPVQSFPEPGVYMGVGRANHEHIITPTPMPRPMTAPRTHPTPINFPSNNVNNAHGNVAMNPPNNNAFSTDHSHHYNESNNGNNDTPKPEIDIPNNEFSGNAEAQETSDTIEKTTVPTATFSEQKKQTGLLERLGKSVSKHSGGILSELSTEDYIIIALVALFLLGADNDGEQNESLVPIVLAALLLL